MRWALSAPLAGQAERIAQLSTAVDCCAARFQAALCRLGVKTGKALSEHFIAILLNNATTSTYGYDAFGTRVYQISASTSAATTTYPFKFFSIASTTKSSTNYATSTEYVFNGDTLLATIDQAFKNGSATGTAQTRYIHPDHLGSTNVVTDQNGNLVQTLDYYPYGGTRVSNSTSTNEKRKWIGQFADDSGLSYLNARYYDSARGQFISHDPTFLAMGNPSQAGAVNKARAGHVSYGAATAEQLQLRKRQSDQGLPRPLLN